MFGAAVRQVRGQGRGRPARHAARRVAAWAAWAALGVVAAGVVGVGGAVAPPPAAAVEPLRTIPVGAGTVVSGDGLTAAYDCSVVGQAQLCVLGVADDDTRLPRPFPEGPGRYVVHDLSTDGRFVLFSHSVDRATYELYRFDLSTHALDDVPTFDGLPGTARLTGDGSRAYLDQPLPGGSPGATTIYVWNAATGQTSPALLPEPGSTPAPSYRLLDVAPDGATLAAYVVTEAVPGGYVAIDPATGAYEEVAQDCDELGTPRPVMSAAARTVACRVAATDEVGAYRAGSPPLLLPVGGAGASLTDIALSRDGSSLLWGRSGAEVDALVVVDLATEEQASYELGEASGVVLIGSTDGGGVVVAVDRSGASRLVVLGALPGTGFTDVPPGHPFYEQITWAAAERIASGYPDGTFGPGGIVSRQAMVAFIHRMAGSPAPTSEVPSFTDVPPEQPFFHAIEWAAEAGIVRGYPDGSFGPGRDVSRQAMAAFVYAFAGSPDVVLPDQPTFTDVPAGQPFRTPIEWLYETGISTGYPDHTYRPGGDSTRQAAVAFLFRYANLS